MCFTSLSPKKEEEGVRRSVLLPGDTVGGGTFRMKSAHHQVLGRKNATRGVDVTEEAQRKSNLILPVLGGGTPSKARKEGGGNGLHR